jgi:quinol monooxygenase YgiN
MSKFAMFGKMKSHPGKRAELIGLLLEAAGSLESIDGCELYILNESVEDEDAIWVNELWRDKEAHAASLRDERVLAIISRARPLIASIEPVLIRPVGGIGL